MVFQKIDAAWARFLMRVTSYNEGYISYCEVYLEFKRFQDLFRDFTWCGRKGQYRIVADDPSVNKR
jgi:hypothetical protein